MGADFSKLRITVVGGSKKQRAQARQLAQALRASEAEKFPAGVRVDDVPWTRAALRHSCKCRECHDHLPKGTHAYRPLSENSETGVVRTQRLCLKCGRGLSTKSLG